MKLSLKYFKKIYQILIWPILFGIGHFIITVIFTLFYNNNLSMSDKQLYDYINTSEYKAKLSQYLNDNSIFIVLLTTLIFFPIFIKLYKKYKRNYINKLNLSNIFLLIILGISISFIFNVSIYLLNNLVNFTNLYSDNNIKNNTIVAIICTGILGPILEEYLFRGIIYNRLLDFVNKKRAIIITSLLFALMHTSYIDMMYAFLISLFLIYIYELYQTLKAPIIIHISANTSIILFLNYIINGHYIIGILVFILASTILITFFKKIRDI